MSYKEKLYQQVESREIELNPDKKYRVVDLEMVISNHIIKQHPELDSWGLQRRLELESPMLCYAFKDLKEEERQEIVNSDRWIAEPKLDGCRCIVSYHPKSGFEFFSRDISLESWLPVSYTEKILLHKQGNFRTPDLFKDSIPFNFVIDCEVISENKNLDTTSSAYGSGGVRTMTELNATVSILGSDPARAHQIQLEQGGLKFYAFDIIYLGGQDLRELPLEQRRTYLEKVIKNIESITPFEVTPQIKENKKDYYNSIVEAGGEGVVLKNLDEKYHSVDARKRKVQVKWKRSMTEALEKAGHSSDLDVFISGFVPPQKGSSFQHLIGGVKVSVFLTNEDNTEEEHFIGVVSGIPHKYKEMMTEINEKNKPILKEEFLGKVIAVDAQDVSSKNLRFSHCRAINDSVWNFRIDKNKYKCTLDRSFILSQVL